MKIKIFEQNKIKGNKSLRKNKIQGNKICFNQIDTALDCARGKICIYCKIVSLSLYTKYVNIYVKPNNNALNDMDLFALKDFT